MSILHTPTHERGVDAFGDPEERGVDLFGDRYVVNVASDGSLAIHVNGEEVALSHEQSAAVRALLKETAP